MVQYQNQLTDQIITLVFFPGMQIKGPAFTWHDLLHGVIHTLVNLRGDELQPRKPLADVVDALRGSNEREEQNSALLHTFA
jgi:hypothetical protein